MSTERKKLLLLHGAMGSGLDFDPFLPALNGRYELVALTLPGHGNNPVPVEDFSINGFSRWIETWANEKGWERFSILGYSMGGYLGLKLALLNPNMVESVLTVGTKFNWSAEETSLATSRLSPEIISEKTPAFAAALQKAHGENNWQDVVQNTSGLMNLLAGGQVFTEEELKAISCPVRLGLADGDKMVSLKETLEVRSLLNYCSLLVIPGARHQLDSISPERLAFEAMAFFN